MTGKNNISSTIVLPPLTDGTALTLERSCQCILIVGTNGAGKSRFAARMAADMGTTAYCLSALHALFDREPRPAGTPASTIDRLYEKATGTAPGYNQQATQLERVMTLLMHDEMLNLLNYKLRHASDPEARMHHTRLDDVINLWQEIFPNNKILIESGQLLFSQRTGDRDRYSAMKLSAGERAVIYYLGAISYAPHGSMVFIDSPEIFLHPTMMQAVWNRMEMLRPDCTFVYTTHDLDFAASRTGASVIWVRHYDAIDKTWDYSIMPPDTAISEDIYMAILGARKPVLFIEGDPHRSIDAKLYPLIFKDYTIRSLGSCNKVIESTRTFNDLNSMHQLDSYGIVDRDRRDEKEVEYLRGKKVMVPEVAEVENILMLEQVIRAVAAYCGKDETRVFLHVKRSVLQQFKHDLHQQALLHTRHRVKRTMEYRIDGRFSNINKLEQHMEDLIHEINAKGLYENFCQEFNRYHAESDYSSVLRVYNQKSMLPASNVAGLCGLHNKEEYIDTILEILRSDHPQARRIRTTVRQCFNLDPDPADMPLPPSGDNSSQQRNHKHPNNRKHNNEHR